MRRAVAFVGLLGVVAAGISLSIMPSSRSAAASEPRTFLIPASDGYGVADCISSRAECGQIVANAWCESQGFGKAVTFGVAAREDFTGSVTKQSPAQLAEQPLSITCGE
ncbi:hypothetical protein ASE61_02350 [Bosea sp. Root670]|jgi:hypothetical protein|uniref:Uncharacterized protein n=1 Tax=Bosea robiniae TaxID=1036780 RepID=A0ABY0NIT3_9HYPH|nr:MULTISPECIES: hypothetical protein [Bosea]KRE08454.1 hypothetical protein ASE61_02350 [Bosea sp. Root670]TQI76403.1 hypothetical protein FHT98_4196 [Bosea sp. AK1]SDF37674.1 hypothetical protein SAMN05421844_101467 [Bosea robiniae]